MTDQPDMTPKNVASADLWRKYFAGEPPFVPDVPLQFPKDLIPTSPAVVHQIYDDVLLAYQRYSPRVPWLPLSTKRTLRVRFRVWRYHLKCDVQQWIHDHLDHAHCDG